MAAADTYYVVTYDVEEMTDSELREALKEIAADFPFSGGNYADRILEEAATRWRRHPANL